MRSALDSRSEGPTTAMSKLVTDDGDVHWGRSGVAIVVA